MKTSKLALTFLTLLLTVSITAQKVKVKKGAILIDKNAVAKLTKSEVEDAAYEYSLTTLADEVVVEFNYVTKTVNEKSIYRWLALKSPNGDLVNEVDFEFVSFTLSNDKALAEFLVKKLEFLNKEGVNTAKIEEFFSEKRTSENNAKANEGEIKQRAALKKFEDINPEVKSDFTIVSNGILNVNGEPSVLGSVKFSKVQQGDESSMLSGENRIYSFYNIHGQLVASASSFFKRIEGGSKYYPLADSDITVGNNIAEANNILKVIFSNDELIALFPTKEQAEIASQDKEKQEQDDYKEAKINSSNIYNQKGYVVDEKGKKWEGEISVAFEKISNPADWSGVVDASSYGSSLLLRYVDEKDRKKVKSFSAKKGARFCLTNEGGTETCYQGMKIQSNGFLGQAATVTFNGVGEVQFLKEVSKEGKAIIYQSTPSNRYVIKTNGQEKAFNFIFGGLIKEEKKIAKLKEYLNGCDYGDGTYDEESFQSIEKIKELINFYNNSCK